MTNRRAPFETSTIVAAATALCATLAPALGCSGPPAATPPATGGDPAPADVRTGDPGAPALVLDKHVVADAAARGAVCNDGSPAIYYRRRGTGAGARRFVIELTGGMFCSNNADCDRRAVQAPALVSSLNAASSKPGPGILSIDPALNPDFYNANHVSIAYCSSDNWSGDRAAETATNSRAFRGRKIVQAVTEDLLDPTLTPAPNLADATDVLLVGESAGGMGVMQNLDWLAGALAPTPVRGLNDAGWFVHVAAYDAGLPGLAAWMLEGLGYWQAKVDASCAAAHAADASVCYFGADIYPELTTPILVHASQRDGNIIGALGVTPPPDAAEAAYVESYAAAVRDSLASVSAAFANAGRDHTLVDSDKLDSVKIAGTSLRDLVGRWYFERGGEVRLIE
ncbi:MAG: hypothetical protein HY903_01885 [Deltaproteobacteria bacterium]|nr:hypothetical protein [Deltaproteobacteria bacterium]